MGAWACGSTSDQNQTLGSPNPSEVEAGAAGAASGSGTSGAAGQSSSCGAEIALETGMVRTDSGVVRGIAAGETWAYRNIPFAAPPLGDLRWRAPESPSCWEGIREGSDYGPLCPQFENDGSLVGEEDCLQLNVWAPMSPVGDKLPVLFWIHGGGHIQGGAPQPLGSGRIYDGQTFAERTGVVIVSINYRLGPLGFLGHTALSAEAEGRGSANYGTLDQLAALQWVRRNVSRFAGDPERVTIFGESAGGVSVCTLLASPLAKGLIAGAIIQSGGCNAHTLADEEAFGAELFQAAGCEASPDPAGCMRDLPWEQVLSAKPIEIDVADKPSIYGSVIDNYTLFDTPGKVITRGEHNHVPVIVGNNDAETHKTAPKTIQTEAQYIAAVKALLPVGSEQVLAAYPASAYPTPRAAFVALTSDAKFVCGARQAALDLAANQSQSVFRYVFTHVSATLPAMVRAAGAPHGLELPYVFGTMNTIPTFTADAGDVALSLSIQEYWARFAATGDPNGDGAVAWPTYAPDDPYLELADPISVGAGFHLAQCEFWAGFGK